MEKSARENEYVVRYKPSDRREEWCYFKLFEIIQTISGTTKIVSLVEIEDAKILSYKDGQTTINKIKELYDIVPGYFLVEIELKTIYEEPIPRFELMDMD